MGWYESSKHEHQYEYEHEYENESINMSKKILRGEKGVRREERARAKKTCQSKSHPMV